MIDGAGAAGFVKQRGKRRTVDAKRRGQAGGAAGAGGGSVRQRGAVAGAGGAAGARRDLAAWADAAAFAGVLGLIVVTPWFRGLFFPMEQMVALLVALGLFAARWWSKFSRNDYTFLRGPLDWAVFGLWLAYLASTFVAANVRAAIQEDMKYLLYFIVYWLVRELATDERRRAMVLGAVAVTGAWVAVLGVGAAAGTFHFNGAFQAPRIFSAFQYPNTTAAYLTAAFAAAVALWARAAAPVWGGDAAAGAGAPGGEPGGGPGAAAGTVWLRLGRAWPAFLWAAAAYAILFCFVFTYSRAAWLLFPAILMILLLLLPRGHRLGALLLAGGVVAAFAPGAAAFPAAVQAEAAAAAWRAFFVGLPLALAGNALAAGVVALPQRPKLAALGAAGLALAIGAGVLSAGRTIVPASVMTRIQSISLETYSARARLEWIGDALRIARDHPIFGAGGGAWAALYHEYQRYGYYSSQVHGHYAQVWVEAGTVGALLLLGIWALVLARAWRFWRRPPKAVAPAGGGGAATRSAGDACLMAGALAGALALGVHSAIDFNLSLAAATVALWSLFGLIEGAAAFPGRGGAASSKGGAAVGPYRLPPRAAAYGTTLLAAVGTASLLLGFLNGQRAARALNAGKGEEARAAYERAVAYDPFTASFRMDLAQVYAAGAQPSKDASLLNRARRVLERGLALEPHNPDFHALHGAFLLRTGDPEAGLAEFERAVALHPYEIRRHETLADALVSVALERAATKGRDQALPVLERVLGIRARLAELRAKEPAWALARERLPASTPHLALRWGEALAIQGEPKRAEEELRLALGAKEPPFAAEAHLWLSQVLAKQGRKEEADALLKKAVALDGRAAAQVDAVKRLLVGG